jgi:hypothetical protein
MLGAVKIPLCPGGTLTQDLRSNPADPAGPQAFRLDGSHS